MLTGGIEEEFVAYCLLSLSLLLYRYQFHSVLAPGTVVWRGELVGSPKPEIATNINIECQKAYLMIERDRQADREKDRERIRQMLEAVWLLRTLVVRRH